MAHGDPKPHVFRCDDPACVTCHPLDYIFPTHPSRVEVDDLRRRVERLEAKLNLVISYVYRAPDRPGALRPEDV